MQSGKKMLFLGIALLFFIVGVFLKENRAWIKQLYPPKQIHVKVIGRVKNPGIYTVDEGSKGLDVIKLAGELNANEPNREQYDFVLVDGQVLKVEDR